MVCLRVAAGLPIEGESTKLAAGNVGVIGRWRLLIRTVCTDGIYTSGQFPVEAGVRGATIVTVHPVAGGGLSNGRSMGRAELR